MEKCQQVLETEVARLKQVEDRCQELQYQLAKAGSTQGEFLANMTHELRTPMYGVIGMLDLTLETELNPTQREYLTMARHSADLMARLINDIFDFSKMEAGQMELEETRFQLPSVIEAALRPLNLLAENKALGLSWSVHPLCPPWLQGDAGRLSQILMNIVGNAVKFTEEGQVELDVQPEAFIGKEIMLRFTVRDTGIGIPEDRLADIYTPFVQVDGSITRKYGGAGLGLSIARHLIQLMGGRLWCSSRLNVGTVFHFTAHFSQPSETSHDKPVDADASAEAKQRPAARRSAIQPFTAQVLDINQGLQQAGGQPGVLRRNVTGFLEKAPPLIAKLCQPLGSGYEATVERIGTELKYAAHRIGATKLADDVFRLQLAVRKEDYQRLDTLQQQIQKALADLVRSATQQDWEQIQPITTKESGL